MGFRSHLRDRPGLLTRVLGRVYARATRRRLAALRRAVEAGAGVGRV